MKNLLAAIILLLLAGLVWFAAACSSEDQPTPTKPNYEIECPNDEHPGTVLVACEVPKACPHKNGIAHAEVYDFENISILPDGKKGPKEIKHILKSISPCNCVVKILACECILCGSYTGTCRAAPDAKSSTCSYLIPCSKAYLESQRKGG
jgi:hypothetical protein